MLVAKDHVARVIEIINARIEQFDEDPGKVFNTISDFPADAGIVLGRRPALPLEVDLPRAGAMLVTNGVIKETGLAAPVPSREATGVAWLTSGRHRLQRLRVASLLAGIPHQVVFRRAATSHESLLFLPQAKKPVCTECYAPDGAR